MDGGHQSTFVWNIHIRWICMFRVTVLLEVNIFSTLKSFVASTFSLGTNIFSSMYLPINSDKLSCSSWRKSFLQQDAATTMFHSDWCALLVSITHCLLNIILQMWSRWTKQNQELPKGFYNREKRTEKKCMPHFSDICKKH